MDERTTNARHREMGRLQDARQVQREHVVDAVLASVIVGKRGIYLSQVGWQTWSGCGGRTGSVARGA